MDNPTFHLPVVPALFNVVTVEATDSYPEIKMVSGVVSFFCHRKLGLSPAILSILGVFFARGLEFGV